MSFRSTITNNPPVAGQSNAIVGGPGINGFNSYLGGGGPRTYNPPIIISPIKFRVNLGTGGVTSAPGYTNMGPVTTLGPATPGPGTTASAPGATGTAGGGFLGMGETPGGVGCPGCQQRAQAAADWIGSNPLLAGGIVIALLLLIFHKDFKL